MYVIKPGVPTNIWRRAVTCPRCEADLGVTEVDLQAFQSGLRGLRARIRCCECGCMIDVTNQVPRETIVRNLPTLEG
jgi:hypothetical protein